MFRYKCIVAGLSVCVGALTLVSMPAQDGPGKVSRRIPPMPGERKAYDKPAEAADFNLRKRITGIESRVATTLRRSTADRIGTRKSRDTPTS